MSDGNARRILRPAAALRPPRTLRSARAQSVPGTFEAEDFDSYYDKTPGNQGDAGYRTGEDVSMVAARRYSAFGP